VTIWPKPEDDPADVSIEQLEGDLERALAALRKITDASSAYGVAEQGGAREIAREALKEIERAARR
jgi:hypothetical protein